MAMGPSWRSQRTSIATPGTRPRSNNCPSARASKMPRGPKGEKRHADTVQNAMLIGRIATGEVEDAPSAVPNRAKGGRVGGNARASRLTQSERTEIAKKATKSRWEQKS